MGLQLKMVTHQGSMPIYHSDKATEGMAGKRKIRCIKLQKNAQ